MVDHHHNQTSPSLVHLEHLAPGGAAEDGVCRSAGPSLCVLTGAPGQRASSD